MFYDNKRLFIVLSKIFTCLDNSVLKHIKNTFFNLFITENRPIFAAIMLKII